MRGGAAAHLPPTNALGLRPPADRVVVIGHAVRIAADAADAAMMVMVRHTQAGGSVRRRARRAAWPETTERTAGCDPLE